MFVLPKASIPWPPAKTEVVLTRKPFRSNATPEAVITMAEPPRIDVVDRRFKAPFPSR